MDAAVSCKERDEGGTASPVTPAKGSHQSTTLMGPKAGVPLLTWHRVEDEKEEAGFPLSRE